MLLKLNDTNELVKTLQAALGLVVDGNFGPKTEAAVKAFQAGHGFVVDGVAGPVTLAALAITIRTPAKLNDADFAEAASMLAVTPAHVWAVATVETSGHGFLADNRPAILFERHQFYKRMITPRKPGETVEALKAKRAAFALANPDICNPSAGGYIGGVAEWDRLDRARAFSDTAGLESASFGLFQIMGFNAVSIGYPSVQAFVTAMSVSEGEQLEAFVRFIRNDHFLLAALRSKDWDSFAYHYNGPLYTKNNYAIKLASAYKLHGGL